MNIDDSAMMWKFWRDHCHDLSDDELLEDLGVDSNVGIVGAMNHFARTNADKGFPRAAAYLEEVTRRYQGRMMNTAHVALLADKMGNAFKDLQQARELARDKNEDYREARKAYQEALINATENRRVDSLQEQA